MKHPEPLAVGSRVFLRAVVLDALADTETSEVWEAEVVSCDLCGTGPNGPYAVSVRLVELIAPSVHPRTMRPGSTFFDISNGGHSLHGADARAALLLLLAEERRRARDRQKHEAVVSAFRRALEWLGYGIAEGIRERTDELLGRVEAAVERVERAAAVKP